MIRLDSDIDSAIHVRARQRALIEWRGPRVAEMLLNPYRFGGAATDPFFGSVDSLLHFGGLNGSTTFTDEKPKTWTRTGAPVISTTESKFGGSSGRFPSGGKISAALGPIGTGDFTVEAFVRPDGIGAGYRAIWFNTAGSGVGLYQKANTFIWYEGGDRCVSAAISAATWYYVAIRRASGTLSLYLDAVASGTTHASTVNLATTQYVGSNAATTEDFVGYIDEFRVTSLARTISTVPTAPFPNS